MIPAATSILFVCTGNAGRSQMAQAVARERLGQGLDVESAGVDPDDVLHPVAVSLMSARGICLEGHRPKSVSSVLARDFDIVITIGDPARAGLPKAAFSASHWIHWDIGDPADADGTPDSEPTFRRTLDRIEASLDQLVARVRDLPSLGAFEGLPGIGTGLWARRRFEPAVHLPHIQAAGFRAVELNLYKGRDHFDWGSRSAVDELRHVADDLGLLIWSIHAPDLGSIASPDEGERRQQIDAIKACLELSDLLGARAVPSHALLLGPFDADPDGCEARISDAVAELRATADGCLAQLAFENAGFPSAAATRSVRILERLEVLSPAGFGFVLDTGHANIDGDLLEIDRHIGDHLVSLHLNDNPGTPDAHLVPGEGTVDWAGVQGLLRRSGYRGVAMYEIELGDSDPEERMRSTMEAHLRLAQDA